MEKINYFSKRYDIATTVVFFKDEHDVRKMSQWREIYNANIAFVGGLLYKNRYGPPKQEEGIEIIKELASNKIKSQVILSCVIRYLLSNPKNKEEYDVGVEYIKLFEGE